MQRRDLLRLLGGVAAVPVLSGLDSERLWAIADGTHARSTIAARALGLHELATVSAAADLIIPRTGTPGAIDAGVPRFVDLLLAEWYDDAERARFLEGLADIDVRSRALRSRAFVHLVPEDRHTVLLALDSAEKREPATAESAYATIKSLTVYGYFTSELVSKTVLKTNVWPGRYDGCVPA